MSLISLISIWGTCFICQAPSGSGAKQGWDLHEERLGASAGELTALERVSFTPKSFRDFFGHGSFWMFLTLGGFMSIKFPILLNCIHRSVHIISKTFATWLFFHTYSHESSSDMFHFESGNLSQFGSHQFIFSSYQWIWFQTLVFLFFFF